MVHPKLGWLPLVFLYLLYIYHFYFRAESTKEATFPQEAKPQLNQARPQIQSVRQAQRLLRLLRLIHQPILIN